LILIQEFLFPFCNFGTAAEEKTPHTDISITFSSFQVFLYIHILKKRCLERAFTGFKLIGITTSGRVYSK